MKQERVPQPLQLYNIGEITLFPNAEEYESWDDDTVRRNIATFRVSSLGESLPNVTKATRLRRRTAYYSIQSNVK